MQPLFWISIITCLMADISLCFRFSSWMSDEIIGWYFSRMKTWRILWQESWQRSWHCALNIIDVTKFVTAKFSKSIMFLPTVIYQFPLNFIHAWTYYLPISSANYKCFTNSNQLDGNFALNSKSAFSPSKVSRAEKASRLKPIKSWLVCKDHWFQLHAGPSRDIILLLIWLWLRQKLFHISHSASVM